MKNKIFTLAGNQVYPGTKKIILFHAPSINTQIKIDIPVHVFHGKTRGPTLFILGALHGDELDSIEIIRRVHKYIRVKELAGTILTIPVVNIYGVIIQSRYLSDRRDLNRSFPGSKKGPLASRLAHGLMEQVVSLCDYGIDLHTGALGRLNMPQIRVDFGIRGAKEFALAFNTPIILEAKQRDGSLRQAASNLGIPVLVYEAGEALRYNELCIRAGVKGIINVLHHLKMVKSERRSNNSKSVITNTSRWVRAPSSGLVQPKRDVFAKSVKEGEVLAHIHDPFLINPSVKVFAPFEGIVIGQAFKVMVSEGDALYHVASFKKVAGVREFIEEYRDEITHSNLFF